MRLRLFTTCRGCGRKIYLDVHADSRRDLASAYGRSLRIRCPPCNRVDTYYVSDVSAEEGVSGVPAGAVIGGLIGLLGGPLGLIIGGSIGALVGGSSDLTEREKVRRFNEEML